VLGSKHAFGYRSTVRFKGKKVLEFYDKVFINDIGLRHGLIGYKERNINGILENIVYKELQSRGYEVKIGVFDNVEIDFCAENKMKNVCSGMSKSCR